MNQKFYNDAIIGNKNIKATFSKKGELLRLYYPTVDFKQFVDFFRVGIKVNDSGIIYLHDDINNVYNQYYTKGTNILNTEIDNTYFKIKIRQIDFTMIKKDVLIMKYIFKNENKVDLNTRLLIDSSRLTDDNNMTSGRVIDNGLIQYSHDYTVSIFSNEENSGHRINDVPNYINSGVLQDKDYIGMSANSAISYDIGTLKPGEEKELNVFLLFSDNSTFQCFGDLEKDIDKIELMDTKSEYDSVKKYWRRYLQSHKPLNVTGFDIETSEKIANIYERTLLLYALLKDEESGGIAATMEIDENRQKCGRYSYCWPRDAVFITRAFDELGMYKESDKFYKTFCKITQSSTGMWEQRFYTDGELAPCWGYQIDETASVIYGLYEHYKVTKDVKLINDCFKMCQNALHFIFKYLEFIFDEKETEDVVREEILEQTRKDGKDRDKIYKHKSYDLWEMNEGVHLYSLASIYAAFNSMLKIYEIEEKKYETNRLKIEQINKNKKHINKEIENIRKYIDENMYDDKQKILHRNCNDDKMDVSIIGSVTPFELFTPTEKKITNTVEKINMTLRTYTGGYIRFEGDNYMGGNNPWPITTLWMALYYIKCGQKQKAMECVKFVTETATELGFLGEQVDNSTMQTNWVIGLGWSHAMYIIVLTELFKESEK